MIRLFRLMGACVLMGASACSSGGTGHSDRGSHDEGTQVGSTTEALGATPGTCTSATFGSEIYYFCSDTKTWTDARTRCTNIPGLNLVRIDGAAENAFVVSKMAGESWTAANDRTVEGTWRWSSGGTDGGSQFWSGASNGSPVGGLYSNWETGQPNDLGTQDCAIIETNGRWDDKGCGDTKAYVCEGDACPNDANKLEPGVCGCGIADTDTDGDGRPDCIDLCPKDPFKVEPGDCGCSDNPMSAGVPCSDGLCAANTTCDGAGTCGAPAACAPDASCTFKRSVGQRGRGYYFCSGTLAWSAARAKCQAVPYGDLARVDDSTENTFLASQIGGDTWLNGDDRSIEGDWFWAQPGSDDGDQFWDGLAGGHAENGFFTNWASGQPDNQGTADCALMQSAGGKWADTNCGNAARYVCEIPPAPSAGLQAGAPWPTASQRPSREGRSPTVAAQTNDINWTRVLNGTTEVGPPIVGAAEIVYVGSGSKFFSVKADGTVAWTFDAAGVIKGAAAIATDGTVYFGSANGSDGRLYALSPTGSLLWTLDVNDPIESSPTVGTDGTLYATEGHHVFAVDPQGRQKWSFTVGTNTGLSASLTPAGTVHMGSSGLGARMRALSRTGDEVWEFNPGADVLTTAVSVANGTAYFGAGSLLFAVSTSGAELWRAQLGAPSTSPLAVGPDGTIYAASAGGRLRAFNPTGGSTKWTQLLGSEITAAPAVGADGTIYVATQGGVVEALRPTDGTVLWSKTTSGPLKSGVAIGANGTVYVPGGTGDGKLYSIGGNPKPFVHCVAQVGPGRFAAAFGYENPTPVSIHIARGDSNKLVPGSTPPSTAIVEDFVPGRTDRAFWELFDGTTTLSWVLRGRSAVASRFSPQCELSDFPPPPTASTVPAIDPDRPSGFAESSVLLLGLDRRDPAHGGLLPDPTSGGTGTSDPPGGIGRIQQALNPTSPLQVPFTFNLNTLFPSLVNVGFCDSPDISAVVSINGQACGSVEVATCDTINVDGCCPGIICKACGQKVETPIAYSCSQNIGATDRTVQVGIHMDEDGDDVMNQTLTIDLLTGTVTSPAGITDSITEGPGGWGVAFDFASTPKPTLPSNFRVCAKWNASYIDETNEDFKGTPVPGKDFMHYPASFAEFTMHVVSPLGSARWGAEYDDSGNLISGTPVYLNAEGCLDEVALAQPVEFTPAVSSQPLSPKELFLFAQGGPPGNPPAGGLQAEMWLVSRLQRTLDGQTASYRVFNVDEHFRSQDTPSQTDLRVKQQHRRMESEHMTTLNGGIPLSTWTQQGFWAVPPATVEVSSLEWHSDVTRTAAGISQMLATDDMYIATGTYDAHANDGCPFQFLLRDSCTSGGVLYIGPETPPPNALTCTSTANCPVNQVCVQGLCSWVTQSRWKYTIAHEGGHQIEERARGIGQVNTYTFDCPNADQCPNQPHEGNILTNPLLDPFGTDVRCRCDHVHAANGLHCLNSIERGDDAYTEGFAQFMAAKTFNRRDDADCSFTYYKEYMEADFSVRIPPLAIDCAAPVRWRNHYCPINSAGTTPQDWADFGTERDWLGFLRATNAISTDRSSLKELFDSGRVACHSNQQNITPCTDTSIGWDPVFQRDPNGAIIIGPDGFGVLRYKPCPTPNPIPQGFSCDAQGLLRDNFNQLVVSRGGLRDGAERHLGPTSTKYGHLAGMGQVYGVDTNLAP